MGMACAACFCSHGKMRSGISGRWKMDQRFGKKVFKSTASSEFKFQIDDYIFIYIYIIYIHVYLLKFRMSGWVGPFC